MPATLPWEEATLIDLRMRIGDDFNSGQYQLKDSASVAYDLTSCTGVVKVYSDPGNVLLCSPTFRVITAASGIYDFGLSDTLSAALLPQIARYAVQITWADATKNVVQEGKLSIIRGV